MMRFTCYRLLFSLSCMIALPAHAGCSRPLQVALSATGQSVIVNGRDFSGVYPELFKSIEAKRHCHFKYTVVPRARQDAMFIAGDADFLFPATRTPQRDQLGQFIGMVSSRAAVMSLDPKLEAFHSIAQVRARKDLRIALVRGYDYGDAYRALLQDLGNERRVFLEADAIGVARLLKGGMADITIMSPSLFASAISTDHRVSDIGPKLRIEPLDELPWTESGVYLSLKSLSAADRAELETLFNSAVRSGQVWESYQRFYPTEVLRNSIRPR
jgi:polar amino acid transport system substrate-binding protein